MIEICFKSIFLIFATFWKQTITEAPEPPIVEARSVQDIDSIIEKHSNIERFVTAVSDYFEPYILETKDKPEEIYSRKLELDSTSVQEIDENFSQIKELEESAGLKPTQVQELDSLKADTVPRGTETGASKNGKTLDGSMVTKDGKTIFYVSD